MPSFQVFTRSDNLAPFKSQTFSIKVSYPAFAIVESDELSIAAVKKHYPVRRLKSVSSPSPLPSFAQLDQAFAKTIQRGPYFIVIKTEVQLNDKQKEAIQKQGIQFLRFIGGHTKVLYCADKKQIAWLKSQEYIVSVNFFLPTVELNAKRSKEKSEQIARNIFIAHFFRNEERELAFRVLKKKRIPQLLRIGKDGLLIDLCTHHSPEEALWNIIQRRGLRSLRPQTERQSTNDLARPLLTNRATSEAPAGLGLDGQGEIISIADTGLDSGDASDNHPDFANRIIDIIELAPTPSWAYYMNNSEGNGGADLNSGHGTHVCGSVAGDGTQAAKNGLPPVIGVAPKAKILFFAGEINPRWNSRGEAYWDSKGLLPPTYGNYGYPDSLMDLFQMAYDKGAKVQVNAWGNGTEGAYSMDCENLDRFVWEHPDFLLVCAAGNKGQQSSSSREEIAQGSVISPGTSKNCITVGACENKRDMGMTYGEYDFDSFLYDPFYSKRMAGSSEDVAALSGRGPTADGRIKPEVLAPGTYVLSTRSSKMNVNWGHYIPFDGAEKHYTYMNGTSFAAPQVAGCALLIRQYLRKYENISSPSAALIKAFLIHSAQYIPYQYSAMQSKYWMDNEQGWGRVELSSICQPLVDHTILYFDEPHGLMEGNYAEFLVQIKSASALFKITLVYMDYPGPELINNLNMVLYDPSGTYYTGNDISLDKEIDSVNNVETIIIDQAEEGEWKIEISGTQVPYGPQPFAIIISGDLTLTEHLIL